MLSVETSRKLEYAQLLEAEKHIITLRGFAHEGLLNIIILEKGTTRTYWALYVSQCCDQNDVYQKSIDMEDVTEMLETILGTHFDHNGSWMDKLHEHLNSSHITWNERHGGFRLSVRFPGQNYFQGVVVKG